MKTYNFNCLKRPSLQPVRRGGSDLTLIYAFSVELKRAAASAGAAPIDSWQQRLTARFSGCNLLSTMSIRQSV
ncbi:hypothetical protein [Spirosoma arcticum]